MDIKTRRKEQIFAAALQCFNEMGYAETSIGIIAKKARISKGGLYHYFTTKHALFLELFLYRVKQYSEQLQASLQQETTPEQRLKILMHDVGRLLEQNEDFYRFCLEFLSMGARDKKIRKVMTAFYRDTVDIFTAILVEGVSSRRLRSVDSKKVARVLYCALIGTFFTFFSVEPDFDFSDHISFQTAFMMKSFL